MERYLLSPFSLDQPAPSLLRLARRGWKLNQPTLAPTPMLSRLAVTNDAIAAFVEESVGDGFRPVSIAGDCCAAIGVVAGLQRAGLRPRILWLDAHGDFNTPETSPSGYLAGMALAMLAGRGDQALPERLRIRPIAEKDVVLCDARDLDPGERAALAASEVRRVTVDQLDAVDFGSGPLYVHFDCDILDPAEAPAMQFPTPGGPALAALQAALRRVAERANIVAVSLTTWAIDQDDTGETERAVNGTMDVLLSQAQQAKAKQKAH